MRQITQDSTNAFLNRQIFTRQNMKVRELNKKYYLKLHNNIIAILHQDNTLIIKNCGWFTPTTKDKIIISSIEYSIIQIDTDTVENTDVKYIFYLRA